MSVDLTLATSRYHNPALREPDCWWVPIGITAGRPRWPLGYKIVANLAELAPTRAMLADYKVDGWPEFSRRMNAQLDALDLDALVVRLRRLIAENGDRGLVLLCFEDVNAGQLCHRRIVAEFLERRLDVACPELWTPTTAATKARRAGQASLI
jgi:hypothetical protein